MFGFSGSYVTAREITLILLLFFFIIDNVFAYSFLKREGCEFTDWYLDLHKRYGFLKLAMFKLLFVGFLINGFFSPPLRRLDPVFMAWFYFFTVAVMLIKYLIYIKKEEK